jgi:3-oxoacyl-[acyl-carrier-protein] synthase II
MTVATTAAEVWITGLALATPLGNSYAELAANLLAGRSGIRRVTAFDVSSHPCQIAGLLETVPCPAGWEAADFARLPRLEQLALWCCSQALRDAGWWEQRDRVRIGLVLGLGAEWLVLWEAGAVPVGQAAADGQSVVSRTAARLGLSGPTLTVSAACASGNYALAQACRWLAQGWVDVCLAGACDAGVTPLSLAGFGNLRALSRRNQEPERASRPFDRQRDGFVMSEGGAVFVLEGASEARRRSARAYARVAGCGLSSDAFHLVMPNPDPTPAATAIRNALAEARLEPAQVDYLNAHATGTPAGDVAEARVLRQVFGEQTARLPVSSTKSMTGHLLTAAAAVEAAACLVALEHQVLPPTINLEEPDPECNLCHVANQAQPQRVRVALSNSFGFGGANTCLVLTRV